MNNAYIRKNQMTYSVLDGWWMDAGETKDALLEAGVLVKRDGANKE